MLLLSNTINASVPMRDLFDLYKGEKIKSGPSNQTNIRVIGVDDTPDLPYATFRLSNLPHKEVLNPESIHILCTDDYLVKFGCGLRGFSLAFSQQQFGDLPNDVVVADSSFLVLRPKAIWKSILTKDIYYFHYLLDMAIEGLRERRASINTNVADQSIFDDVFIRPEFITNSENAINGIHTFYEKMNDCARTMEEVKHQFNLAMRGNFVTDLLEIKTNSNDLVQNPMSMHTPIVEQDRRNDTYRRYRVILNVNGQTRMQSLKDWARANKGEFGIGKYVWEGDNKRLPTTHEIERVMKRLNFRREEDITENTVTYRV